jgi:hypothetical protein
MSEFIIRPYLIRLHPGYGIWIAYFEGWMELPQCYLRDVVGYARYICAFVYRKSIELLIWRVHIFYSGQAVE